jgi:hypothetical protein
MATQAQKERFFREHYQYALQAGLDPLRATMAVSQAALETGWGEVGQAVKGNNFHGMKVGDDWTGPVMDLDTREEDKGRSYTINDKFRKYQSPVESYRDWAKKMATNWPGVLQATNLSEALTALDNGVKGKYSTSSTYADKVTNIAGQLAQSGVPQMAATLPSIDTGGLPDLDHPATPGWLSGPVAATPVDVEDFSTASPLGGGLPGATPSGLQMVDGYRARLSSVNFDEMGLDPTATAKAKEFQAEAARRNLDLAVDIRDMVRTPERQAEIKKSGFSWTTKSEHMAALAMDVSPVDVNDQAAWQSKINLATELGWGQLGPNDPAHMGLTMSNTTPGALDMSKEQAIAARDYFGSVPMSERNLRSLGLWDGVPTPQDNPNKLTAAPIGEVERRSLPDIVPDPYSAPIAGVERSPLAAIASESVAALPAESMPPSVSESVSPLAAWAETLSPISSAQAAEPFASESVSPFTSEMLSPLQSEMVAPLSDFETVVGEDITDSFTGPSALMGTAPQRGWRQPVAEQERALGAFQPANVSRAIDLASMPAMGDLFAERVQPTGTAQSLSPISTASPLSAIPGSVVGSLDSLYQKPEVSDFISPLASETLSPLSSETISPISDYETIKGTDITMPSMGLFPGQLGLGTTLAEQTAALPNMGGFVSPVPGAPPASTVSPAPPTTKVDIPSLSTTPDLPALDDRSIFGTPTMLDDFPAAPEISTWDQFTHVAKPIAKYASIGNTIAGPIGALAGGALGAFGFNGLNLGPQFDNVVPQSERFSTGFGLPGIMGAMGGPLGAQGFSMSNPGMSFTSFGDRVGTGGVGLRRSDKFGWTEVVGPDGSVRGIHFDNPMGGGVFGDISRSVGGFFGGGLPTDKERSELSGKAGLW